MSLALDQPSVVAAPAVRPMSTLQLGLHWLPEIGGGAERLYFELLRNLPAVGVESRGLVVGSDRAEIDSAGSVRAFASPEAKIWQRWRASRREIGRELATGRFDLIASHFALYTYPARGLMRRSGVPLVAHFHGPWASEAEAEGSSRLGVYGKAMIERGVYRDATRLIVLSDAFGKILEQRYGIPADRIRRVPPGIDTTRYRTGLSKAAAREKLGWPTDRPVVLAVRRLVQRMGLENLIEAMEQLRRDVPDVLVLIAGKGPMADSLQKQINERGLDRHVRLLGFVPDDDLPAAYTAPELTIVPSLALEGFGLIVIESLAAGTPVLVTPVGGLPESVRDLSPALMLEGADPASIARGITQALRSPAILPSSVACRSFAEETYDWRVIAPKVKAVYEEAIAC